MFHSVRSFIEKNLSETELDKRINSIKVKIKDGLSIEKQSPKQSRHRAFALTFNDVVVAPPPLPNIAPNKDFFTQSTTEYATQPFSFYHEDFEETFPAPKTNVEETDLPIVPEPQDGMHPFEFDQMEMQVRRNQTPARDIKPHFLMGKENPMRTFAQTPVAERVLSYQDLQSPTANLSTVTYVCITDQHLTTKTKKLMWRKVFNLLGNPICRDDYQLRLSAKLPVLETISQKQLPIDDRIKAITLYGRSDMRARIDMIRWSLYLDNLPEIRNLRPVQAGWNPSLIHHLVLQNCQLKTFYVGNLPNLAHLDLTSNLIVDITNTGMERCNHLRYINLRGNLISRLESLNVFEMIPALRILILENNRIEGYRQRLIYITRNLRGVNRAPGLVAIDEAPISREERIKAIETHDNGGVTAAAQIRWKLLLIERYGHMQLQTIPDYLAKAKSVTFPRCHLSVCEVSVFGGVQVLDLSNNELTQLNGLHVLRNLRILYLQDNPDLDTNSVLQQLTTNENIESFSFFVTLPTHSRSVNSREYRARVLQTIVPKNRSLMLIDSTTISFNERVDAYINAGFQRDVVEKYRFFLALTVNCTMHFNRGIHPDQVEIGNQYDPYQITGLRRLRDWNLLSEACNFSSFPNVTEIDLTNNKIVDISTIGLQNLSQLRRLSVINNAITTPLAAIAQLLDSLTSLEIFAIRGNPCMQGPQDRLGLIGYMGSMKQLESTLKVIDTEITIYDKVEGWKLVGGSLMDAELFKLSYIVSMKSINLFEENLVNLELSDCALEYLDVTPFVNLKALLLPNNKFSSMRNIKSIESLTDLYALDLRHNEFKSAEDICGTVLCLSNLAVLGVFGNPFTANKNNYRVKFLVHIPPVYQHHRYPLLMLDTTEIGPEEIAEAALSSLTRSDNSDRREMLFNVSLLRRSMLVSFELLVELDLQNCSLTHLSLHKLPNLVILNISDNLISDTNLKESGIPSCRELRALDLRNNKIKDILTICKVVDILTLETIFIEENTCFDKDTDKERVRFFKKLTNSNVLTTLKFLNGTAVMPQDTLNFAKTKSRK
eukprot:gene7995-9390_t